MKLITKALEKRLLANGAANASGENTTDFKPVVKLFTPDAGCTWLLTELDPNNPDFGFGLCDLGFGEPELGYVSISELSSVKGPLGLPIERDMHFTANYTLSEYADKSREAGQIVA